MTLTISWKKVALWTLAAIAVIAACVGARYQGLSQGRLEGIRAYHSQCFEVGGYIIDEQGQVVACKGQGNIPKEELKNFKSTI